jgi:hypothetical protein
MALQMNTELIKHRRAKQRNLKGDEGFFSSSASEVID